MLHFANVGTLQHELAHAALTNTSTNRLGQGAVQQHAVPSELFAFGTLAQVQLLDQRFGIDTDSHGGELKGAFKDGVPNQQVSIDAGATVGARRGPVVVIGGTSIVAKFAVGLPASNAHQEDSSVFLADNVLAFLGGGIGVLLEELVGGAECDFFWKECRHTIFLADLLVSSIDRLVDILDSALKSLHIAIFRSNDLLPVPLIDVQRVRVINIVVAAKTTKVGDNSLAWLNAVVVKRPALPLGQREGNFELNVLKVARSKGCRAFDTIEIVIKARALSQEQRARDTLKVDIFFEVCFKGILDHQKSFFLFQQVADGGLVSLCQQVLGRESG
mmetsp:Transcript_538/g.1571  ORF Transcript_538/g.1571 Transcript_538/m.1571 type:complete len:331 (+) Transcript_538:307-1299(+)